jgi:hypothetical protein
VDESGKLLGPEHCLTFGNTISDFGPERAADYAKALAWAFIAGFAERLVPDALQSFAAKATCTKSHSSFVKFAERNWKLDTKLSACSRQPAQPEPGRCLSDRCASDSQD